MSATAYSTAQKAPHRLGSSARRSGRDAERQRAAITSTTASDATIARTRRAFSSAFAVPASGDTSSRLSSSGRYSSRANGRTRRSTMNAPTRMTSSVDVSRPPVTKLRNSATKRAIHRSPNSRSAVNATGESSWASTGDSRTPKPVTVNRRPTALSGRWRHASRPHAMKEMPASRLITAYPGSAGPRSNSTGISAAKPAAAAATAQRQPEPPAVRGSREPAQRLAAAARRPDAPGARVPRLPMASSGSSGSADSNRARGAAHGYG